MRVTIVVVGRMRGPLAPAVQEFEARASHYWRLSVAEVDGGLGGSGRAPEAVREAEAERVERRIPVDGEVWALTREGRPLTSARLAETLADRMTMGSAGVTFLIGGAFGLDDRLVRRSDRALSLSRFTFPHELARLVLAEQIYRAGTILRNEPYHKGDG